MCSVRFYRCLHFLFVSNYCDSCEEYIVMTRYLCLDCSTDRYIHTIDLCARCVDKEFIVFRDNGAQQIKHKRWHSLLQIRRALPFRQQYTARENARITLRDAPSDLNNPLFGPSRVCHMCPKVLPPNVPQRPYWSCCECLGE